MRSVNQTRAVKSYFRGNANFGRTTTLLDRETGEELFVVMGAAIRKQAYEAFVRENVK